MPENELIHLENGGLPSPQDAVRGSTSKCNSNSLQAVHPARKNVPKGNL